MKKTAILIFGSGFAQTINLIVYALMARIYEPERFGQFAVLLGIATIIGKLAPMRYEVTILLPKEEQFAQVAFNTALLVSVGVISIFNILGMLFIFILGNRAGGYYEIYSVMIIALSVAAVDVCSFKQTREERYFKLVSVQILKVILFGFFGVILAELGTSTNGLMFSMAGASAAVFIFVAITEINFRKLLASLYEKAECVNWAVSYSSYPKLSSPAVLVSSMTALAPTFLLAVLIGDSVAGYFNLIQKVIMTPINVISGAINRTYLRSVAKIISEGGQVMELTRSLISRMSVLSIFVVSLVWALLQLNPLATLLGRHWLGIDTLAIILVPAFGLGLVAKCVAGFAVLGKNALGLNYQLGLFLLVTGALVICTILTKDVATIFMSLSVAFALGYLLQITLVVYATNSVDRARR